MCKRVLLWTLTVLLLAGAGTATLYSLRPEGSAQKWVLESSAAVLREGETMTVALPVGPINLNTAAEDELCAIKGIGPSLAREIIAQRENNGLFAYAEDLLSVRGVGQKTLDKLRGQFCLQ